MFICCWHRWFGRNGLNLKLPLLQASPLNSNKNEYFFNFIVVYDGCYGVSWIQKGTTIIHLCYWISFVAVEAVVTFLNHFSLQPSVFGIVRIQILWPASIISRHSLWYYPGSYFEMPNSSCLEKHENEQHSSNFRCKSDSLQRFTTWFPAMCTEQPLLVFSIKWWRWAGERAPGIVIITFSVDLLLTDVWLHGIWKFHGREKHHVYRKTRNWPMNWRSLNLPLEFQAF